MAVAAYPQYPSEIVRPPSGASIPALIALGANALWLNVLAVIGVWGIYLAEDGTDTAENLGDVLALGTLAEFPLILAAGVAVIVWMWRARTNADVIDDYAVSWRRPWVIFGWILPIISFFVPRVIIAGVWRASAPNREPVWPVNLWWAAYLVFFAGLRVVSPDIADGAKATLFPVVVEVGAIAAVLAMLIVWRITRFQEWQATRLRQAVFAGA